MAEGNCYFCGIHTKRILFSKQLDQDCCLSCMNRELWKTDQSRRLKIVKRNESLASDKSRSLYNDPQWLSEHLKTKTFRQMADMAGTSLRTIARKVHNLGLISEKRKAQSREWISEKIRQSMRLRYEKNRRNFCSCGNKKTKSAKRCFKCFHKIDFSRKYRCNYMVTVRTWVKDYWRIAVFQRDGFKCVSCGKRSGLNAHHKIPLSVLCNTVINEASANDKDDGIIASILLCDSRVRSVENGITLCTLCHKKEHAAAVRGDSQFGTIRFKHTIKTGK